MSQAGLADIISNGRGRAVGPPAKSPDDKNRLNRLFVDPPGPVVVGAFARHTAPAVFQ